MIRLGLRLTLGGGREAAVRLAVTAGAVALGVGLLLVALAGINGINRQNARAAWINTGVYSGNGPGVPTPGGPALPQTSSVTAAPLWWDLEIDHYDGHQIYEIQVAATGTSSPVPPGIPADPGPGQYYASPSMTRLLSHVPSYQLAARYGARPVGTIGPSALPSPNSLIIVIGRSPAQMAKDPQAGEINQINTAPGLDGPAGYNNNRLATILAVGALALLFPVLIFIATAARLATARREQRFAAMRLIGASPRQVSLISAVEGSVAAIMGVIVGFGVFFAARPLVTHVGFAGSPLANGDLYLSGADISVVAIGVPVAAALAALAALRRVRISPLGISRRVTPKAPGPLRLLPLVAGVVELLYFVVVGHPHTTGGQIQAYMTGCFLIMVGLVTAGPWLTMVGARLVARRTSRPASLIAGRRMVDNPRAAFRTISGLIIALFATSVSVGIITTILHEHDPSVGTASNDTVVSQSGPFVDGGIAGPADPAGPVYSLPAGLVSKLMSIHGVRGVTVLRSAAQGLNPSQQQYFSVLADCVQLAHTPVLGKCAPGESVAAIDVSTVANQVSGNSPNKLGARRWPSAHLSPAQVEGLPIRAVLVQTYGGSTTVESVRTRLDLDLKGNQPAVTLGEAANTNLRQIRELQQMTSVVIIVSLVIAGCSLAVSVSSGVNERKRPFSLLRLSGVPLTAIRKVVALEAAVPLLIISVISAGMGFLAAALFLNSQLKLSLQPPPTSFYVLVGVGLVASLAIVAATLPIVSRITGPEVARNE